jgi:hypothetical protein
LKLSVGSWVMPTLVLIVSAGFRTAAQEQNSNAIEGQLTITVAGNATVGPSVHVDPNPITFASQAAGTSSQPQYVDVESSGDSTLTTPDCLPPAPAPSRLRL